MSEIPPARLAIAVIFLIIPAVSGGSLPLLHYFLPAAIVSLLSGSDRAAFIMTAASMAGMVLAITTARPAGMPLIVENTGLAFIILHAERHGYSGPVAMLTGTLFLISTVIVSLSLMSDGGFNNAIQAITAELANSLDRSFAEYQSAGNGALPPEATIWFEQIKKSITAFFPGITGCSLGAAAMSNVMLTRYWTKKHYQKELLGPDFSGWQFPDWLIWLFIVSAASALFGDAAIESAGRNGLLVTGFLYLIQGVSLIQYYFQVIKCPVYIRWLTWLVLGLQWYGMVIISAFGIACTWFDIRGFIDKKFGDDSKKETGSE